MSFRVRAARAGDLAALYEMAKLTGGGFTNLPPDRGALREKLAISSEAFARTGDDIADDVFLLVLEKIDTRQVRGTAQLFTRIGKRHPFYSYRLGTLRQNSKELARTFSAEMLSLTTDLEGSSEVGGLFLHPGERAGGLGQLLARSRYLFIRRHRARFAQRVIAELRGVIDEGGGSPFWDGLAGRFFGMSFQEADEFNAVHGYQFIADLMPKHPIYTAMLTEAARAVIGLPHPGGRAAMRMLEAEGFAHAGYVDIFDGGPTMIAPTDALRTVRDARESVVTDREGQDGAPAIVSTGSLASFVAAYAELAPDGEGVAVDAAAWRLLGLSAGDELLHVAR